VEDWKTLSDDYGKAQFKKQWTDKFLPGLAELYNGDSLPKLERGATAKVLEQLRFTKVNEIPVCKKRQDPRVSFREVQNALGKLQALYDGHIVHMWRIINSLIYTIVDPVKKTEMVRLHHEVTAKSSTKKFVETLADEARDRITEFYLQVEKIYAEAVKSMKDLDS
jgi:hypothetical protein